MWTHWLVLICRLVWRVTGMLGRTWTFVDSTCGLATTLKPNSPLKTNLQGSMEIYLLFISLRSLVFRPLESSIHLALFGHVFDSWQHFLNQLFTHFEATLFCNEFALWISILSSLLHPKLVSLITPNHSFHLDLEVTWSIVTFFHLIFSITS